MLKSFCFQVFSKYVGMRDFISQTLCCPQDPRHVLKHQFVKSLDLEEADAGEVCFSKFYWVLKMDSACHLKNSQHMGL